MRIGIDIQATQGRGTGLSVYTENLIRALQRESENGFQFHFYGKPRQEELNTLKRLFWENIELPRLAKKDKIDVLHVPAFAPPCWRPSRLVVTVHDLIGLTFPNQGGWPSRFYWGRWLPARVKEADKIIADSEHTKKDIVTHLQVSEEKIVVIYPSGHEGFSPEPDSATFKAARERFNIKEKYFLTVGTLEPRKNLFGAIEAFSKFIGLHKENRSYQLVLVGSLNFAHGKFVQRLRESHRELAEQIIFTDYVEREVLNGLYSNATAFIFPSLYEGFGIPLLEAMASGVPVITSRLTSIPEVAGDAAYYADPKDPDSLACAMSNLAKDDSLRSDLIHRGLQRTGYFNWSQTAKRVLSVYRSLS